MRQFRTPLIVFALAVLSLVIPSLAWAGCTVPNNLTNGQTADASQVMANFNSVLTCVNNAPAGSTNALQFNAGAGVFGSVGPLTNGQIVIGSTGAAPKATTITGGPGITITNGPGKITVSGAGTPYTVPLLANFTVGNSPTGATAADTSTGLAMLYPASLPAWNVQTYWDNTPYPGSGTETITVGLDLMLINGGGSAFTGFGGFAIGDSTGKFITFSICDSSGGYQANINYVNSYTSYSSNPFFISLASYARFISVVDDGTNFNFYVGSDINSMIKVWSASKTAFIGTPTKIGLVVQGNSEPVGATFFDYTRTP